MCKAQSCAAAPSYCEALLLAAALAIGGCAATSVPCTQPTHCSAELECLASRCVPRGTDPVVASKRLLLDARHVAILGTTQLQSSVRLGGASGGDTLYVDFGQVPARRQPNAAFLLLNRAANTAPPREPSWLSIRAVSASILTPEQGAKLSPSAGSVEAVGRAGAARIVRVDVSAWLANAWSPPNAKLGLVVESKDEQHWAVATGLGSEVGPRLELYFEQAGRASNQQAP